MSDGRGQQPGTSSRRRYRVAGSGDYAAAVAQGAQSGDPDDHIADLAAGYALGALELAERERVERHVRTCPSCARLLAADTRVTGFLPYLAQPIAPALDVKVALFSRIAHAERAAAPSILPAPTPAVATPTIPASRPLPLVATAASPEEYAVPSLAAAVATRPRRGWAAMTALGLPLLLSLVGVGAWGMEMRRDAATASAELGAMQAQYANFAAGRTFALQPGTSGPGAQGSLTVSAADQSRVLLSMQFDDPAPDRVYELLVNDGEKIVPKADFEVRRDGRVQEVVDLDLPYDQYESIEIKAKPVPGGSTGATESILSNDVNGSIGDTDPSANDLIP